MKPSNNPKAQAKLSLSKLTVQKLNGIRGGINKATDPVTTLSAGDNSFFFCPTCDRCVTIQSCITCVGCPVDSLTE